MESSFRGRSVLITGGTGAFGQKFLNYLKDCGPASVTLLSRDEMKHAAAKRLFGGLPWVNFRIGDICRMDDLQLAASDADVIVHAAAMKHLPECEANPLASNRINVQGTENVVRTFLTSKADTLIFLSTDKAPYASSIYGSQKYIGEKLVSDANSLSHGKKRSFSLRYSNVIDSTGAAFHIFGNMLKAGKKVTVNGSQTLRGFVTQAEVISCIESSMKVARGGETIVLRPRVIRISELATSMRDILDRGDVEIKETTSFQGEKDSATLIMAEECGIAKELPECPVEAYLLDFLGRHVERQNARFERLGAEANGPLTLEHCQTISGKELKDFLLPVLQSNEFIERR